GTVYAANTFGAVAGTLLAPFVLMPAFGLNHSCWALAAINGVVSASVLFLLRASRTFSSPDRVQVETLAPRAESREELASQPEALHLSKRLAITSFVPGLLG